MINIFKKYVCVKQHDSKDCGCACLATICKQYNHKLSLSKLREISGTDVHGTSAYGIVEAAKQIGFTAKGVKVKSLDNIFDEFPLPAIAHVIMNNSFLHYVVIHKVSKKEIIVADPAKGIIKYNIKEFFEIWTGILIIMAPIATFQKVDETENVYKRFFKLLIPQKKLVLNIFFVSILITILGIVGAFYFQLIMDQIIPNNLLNTLNAVSIAFIILGIFKLLLDSARTQLIMYLSQNIDIPLILGYYEHVVNLPMKFFSTRKIGDIISRFNDAYEIRNTISGATLTIMLDILMVSIGSILLYCNNVFLFKITLIPVLLYIIIVFIFNKTIEKVNRDLMESNSILTSYLVESLNSIEVVKEFNRESSVILETEKRFVKLLKKSLKSGTISNIQSSIKVFIKCIFSITLLWLGCIEIINRRISLGQLVTFNALLAYFLDPIESLIGLQPLIKKAVVAAERLAEILDLEVEKSKNECQKINPKSFDNIELKNVSFRYGSRQLILNDINIKIAKGEKIALVGESGSGKTTIAKLIIGLYQPHCGEIIINDYNSKDINLEHLRNKIAYLSQNNLFFSGSIKENLYFANNKATYEEIIEACKKAQIHDYINSLPMRYDTILSENASNLSGGEKQRLAIARALLRKPDILILDESTSNLDSITETAIQRTINNLSKNIITIIIAHKLSTIINCDKVYVIDNGKVVESGTHSKLITKGGLYSKFWKNQFYSNKMLEETAISSIRKEVAYEI